jgi:hypothetical protein
MTAIMDMEHEECQSCGKLIPLDTGYICDMHALCDQCAEDFYNYKQELMMPQY